MLPVIVYTVTVSVLAVVLYLTAVLIARQRNDAEDRNRELDRTLDHLKADLVDADARHDVEVEVMRLEVDLWRRRAESLLRDASAMLARHYDAWQPVDVSAQDDAA